MFNSVGLVLESRDHPAKPLAKPARVADVLLTVPDY